MIAALRSELRKIVTLRSTYVIFGFAVLLVLFMDGWVMGYKHTQLGATFVADVISSTLMGTGFLLGLIVLLQITQEYRHNTIYYTLTLVRRRTTVFWAKVIVASLCMMVGALTISMLGVASAVAGVAASGDSLGAQSIVWSEILPRAGVYVWGVGMFALIVGFLVRNQVGAIVLYLFGINIAEQVLTLLLKSNAGYLPFRALQGVLGNGTGPGPESFSPEKYMLIVLGWIVATGASAWVLFVRRDAN